MWQLLVVCLQNTQQTVSLVDIEVLMKNLMIGGPTGLLTGLLLHRLGVSVSILGKNICICLSKF